MTSDIGPHSVSDNNFGYVVQALQLLTLWMAAMSWGALIEQLIAADLIRLGVVIFVIGLLIGAAVVLFRGRAKR